MQEMTYEDRKQFISNLIGKKIFNLRKSCKLSREQLAEMSNLSTTYIFDIENGNSMPSCLSIIDICNALKVPTSQLLDEFSFYTEKLEPLTKNFNRLTKKEKAAITNLINFMSNDYVE